MQVFAQLALVVCGGKPACQLRSRSVAQGTYTVQGSLDRFQRLGWKFTDNLVITRLDRNDKGMGGTVRVHDSIVCVGSQVLLSSTAAVDRNRFMELLIADAQATGTASVTLLHHEPYEKMTAAVTNPFGRKDPHSMPSPMPLYVLNLDRRPARWAAMAAVCKEHAELACQRISAIDGKAHSLTQQEIWAFRDATEFNMLVDTGVVGCALSHVQFWKTITDTSIIIEDDLLPRPGFSAGLKAVSRKLPTDFDIVFIAHQGAGLVCPSRKRFTARLKKLGLESNYEPDVDLEAAMDLCPQLTGAMEKEVSLEQVNSLQLYRLQRPLWIGQGTGGYVISKAGAAKLLRLYEENGMPEPVDMFLTHRFLHLNMFVASVSLCYARDEGSSDTGTVGATPVLDAQKTADQIRLMELKLTLTNEPDSWKLDCWLQLVQLYQAQHRWAQTVAALESAFSLEVAIAKQGGGAVDPEARRWFQNEFRKLGQVRNLQRTLQERIKKNFGLVRKGLTISETAAHEEL